MVARAAKTNVPTKKAIASVLSLILISYFGSNSLLINMNNFSIYAFLGKFFAGLAGIRDYA
jgi:uncharacterized membrane protein